MKETFLFLKKLTAKKVINAASVYLHYWSSIVFKTSIRGGYPTGISVESGTFCNLRCKACPSGQGRLTRPQGEINPDLFKKITDEFAPYITNLIFYFQGEPYLNKHFFDLTEYASLQKKIFTITSSNAHFIDKENAEKTVQSGLDKIIISTDGIRQKTYEKYRTGGNLSKVKAGIKNLAEAKKKRNSRTPFIELQFIVFSHNESEIPEMKQFAKQSGADKLALKTAQIDDFEKNADLIPKNRKYARYKKNAEGKYVTKSKLKNRCKRLWESAVITWDGKLLPCCFDKDAKHVLGDLSENNFWQTDRSEKAVSFRKKILKKRQSVDICKNCTEGLRF